MSAIPPTINYDKRDVTRHFIIFSRREKELFAKRCAVRELTMIEHDLVEEPGVFFPFHLSLFPLSKKLLSAVFFFRAFVTQTEKKCILPLYR